MLKKLTQTLSFRLFILLFLVLAIGFGFYAYHTVSTHTNNLMESVYRNADDTSDIIKRSMRYAMLMNRKEDAQNIVSTIGGEQGVEGIRIYNKRGEIIFSTDSTELHTRVEMQADACNVCHALGPPHVTHRLQDKRMVNELNGHRVLTVIDPIMNEPGCSTAACHAHSQQETVLGVLDVRMSLAEIDDSLRKSRRGMISYAVVFALGVAVFSGTFIFYVVRRRIKSLIVGTKELAAGNLDYRISVSGNDEISLLKQSFNKMTEDLQKARAEITEWSNTLAEKVESKTKELEKARDHIVRMEKLASLGKLSASIAHEINNPLAGTMNYIVLALRILANDNFTPENIQSLNDYLLQTKNEINRCGQIVRNMLIFANQSGGHFAYHHLHSLIESSLMFVSHHPEQKQIEIIKKFNCADDRLYCDAIQIRQVVVALCANAIEAIDKQPGLVTIETKSSDDRSSVLLIVRDNGKGIAAEVVPHIFDPFFSTKKEVKGVGLGLSIVYGIIDHHKGKIQVESQVGQGTTITIELPRQPQKGDPTIES
jgi:two-component system NtrC family sensor kinase